MSSTAKAAVLCVVACAFFAIANALGKAAQTVLPGPELHPLQVTAARFVAGFAALLPWLIWRGPRVFRTAVPLRHLVRVLLGAVAVTCIFAALQRLPLAEVLAIAWSAPLFAVLFAAWFLRERVDFIRALATLVGFVGVAVMLQPSGAGLAPIALLALAAAVCTGAEVVMIRVLARTDPALTVLALNNALGAIVAVAAASVVYVTPSPQQAWALAGVGAAMVAGQALFMRALWLAEASVVAPFYYATLAWAALIGVVVFGEVPGWHLYLGGALVVAGGLLVGARAGGRRPSAQE